MFTYSIQRTSPTVYLDQTGSAINGFKVTIHIDDVDETHFMNVSSLDPKVVKDAAEKLIKQREALQSLGSSE